MPELPEVETIRRDLARVIIGKTIAKITINNAGSIKPTTTKQIKKDLLDATIINTARRAKILILTLDTENHLLVHLKMTGQLIYQPSKVKKLVIGGHPQKGGLDNLPNKFTRAIFEFTDGSVLYFNDLRKFGWLRVATAGELEEIKLKHGPEPLAREFTLPYFETLLKRYSKRPIKALLLDQKLIAGLGNIYVDESLFLAKILPNKKAGLIRKPKAAKLFSAIIETLKLAIKKKGTSSRNYRRADGGEGGMFKYLKVYGRAGRPCHACATPIKKIKFAGRGTHFCPKCQK
jgi:formamidopyrimidine-DNA glycosylase